MKPDRKDCHISIEESYEIHDLHKHFGLVPQRMLTALKGLISMIVHSLFDSIREGNPIDYTRSIMILRECMDYRSYRWDLAQKLTFCIPLRPEESVPGTLQIPASQAVSCGCPNSGSGLSIPESMKTIGRLFTENILQQSDMLRFTLARESSTEFKFSDVHYFHLAVDISC